MLKVDATVGACYRAVSVRSLLFLVALSLLPAHARAEGSTLSSEKMGACTLLTVADAQRISNVPMEFQARPPGNDSPGRECTYRPVQAGPGRATVALRLLDGRAWSRFKAEGGASRLDMEGVRGIGDEAYVVKRTGARRPRALVLFVRRGRSQFSVRFAGAGLDLTEPMKQLARTAAARLPAGP